MGRTVEELAEWADPAKTCILLGSGASIPSGCPSAAGLASALRTRFSLDIAASLDLASTAEIVENRVGRRPLVEAAIAAVRSEPVGGIADLPSYPWKSIFTTNYDTLIEQSCQSLNVPLAVVRSRFDFPNLDALGALRLFKIHGCVTQDRAFGDPSDLILTRGDYRRVRSWKNDLLQRMQVEMETSNVLIIGHSLADPHLDELIEQVVELQEELGFRNRVSILSYTDDQDLKSIYEARQISVTVGDIDWLVACLAQVERKMPLDRHQETDAGYDLLPKTVRPVTIDVSQAVRAETSVRTMYSGSPASYFDIVRGRTFERDAVPMIAQRLSTTGVGIILGSAGLGKTTMARQVALSRRSDGLQVFEHRTDLPLDVEAWCSVNRRLREAGDRGLLLLDNATKYQRMTNGLLRRLPDGQEQALEVLITAEQHRWDRLVKHPSLLREEPFRVGRLSHREMKDLVRLSRDNESVRGLVPTAFAALSDKEKFDHLRRTCLSDIFVCLRNVFSASSFDTIILEEFAELDESIQEIYRLVAGLEAISGGSHRQLILRMLGIDARQIPNLLSEMRGLLVEATEGPVVDGIFVWRTRHPQIADIVARYKFADPQLHLDLIEDLVAHLNPAVDIERNAIRGLCNESLGLDWIKDSDARLKILEHLSDRLPDDHVLRHRLVREFLRRGSFPEAETVLEKAIEDVGMDPPLLRFRVELYRKKAVHEEGLAPEDREALLRWAWAECQTGVNRYTENWHTYRSQLDVASDWLDMTSDGDWLEQALDDAQEAYSRLYEPNLVHHIQRAEKRLRSVSR